MALDEMAVWMDVQVGRIVGGSQLDWQVVG